jgi:hypothetical protein
MVCGKLLHLILTVMADYLVGNWGMNSKFKANKLPMKMYYDFDNNGSFEK